MGKVGLVVWSCVVAFATAQGQVRPAAPAAPPRPSAVVAPDSGVRATVRDTSAPTEGLHLVFDRQNGRPPVRVTGWRAALIVLGFFGGLTALVWWLVRLRRRARSLVQRGEMQYRMLFERNPCPMFVYDAGTLAIGTANRAAAELLGVTTASLKGRTLRDLFPAEGAAEAMNTLHGEGDADGDSVFLTRMYRANGARLDVDVRGRQLDDDGDGTRLVMVLDVTRRLLAEGALRGAEQRARTTSEVLQSLIDVAPQAILALDRESRVTLWNRAAESLFGWSAAEVLGKGVPYVPPEHEESFTARKQQMDQSGNLLPTEVTRLRKNGTRVEVLAAAGAVRDTDGKAAGYIGIFTDLTQHRLLEAQLRQSQKLEAVGRLAGGIAHDFNNLLTVITSYVEMLQAPHGREAEPAYLKEIGGAAARAAALTRQLLTFSRKQIVQHSTVDVNEVVARIEPMLRRVSAQNIHLRSSLASDLGLVHADAGQLEQVILNLVVNASDAMPDGGSLVLQTANVELDQGYALMHAEVVPGPYVMLAVSDTGVGMNEATLAKIFEPFFTTKEPGHGTGLGLAMAYEIVRQAGGHIWVYSEVDGGATFKIYLPRIDAAAEASLAPNLPAAAVARGGTVLLVEDDDAVRRSVRTTLERLGYIVLEASDGESGLAVAERQGGSIDVVVTDLMMPGITGREFAERLAVAWPGLRVVFTSGYTDDEVIRRRLVDEGQSFLQKPFTSEQLVGAIDGPPANR
jgi:two-component system cell cycle sensor histidine kinase/response regulator CckA